MPPEQHYLFSLELSWPHFGQKCFALTPETRIGISANFSHDILNGAHLRQWLVSMPLQILALPVQLPYLPGIHKGCLGNRDFMGLSIAPPNRTNFKDFHAMALKPKAKINLLPNVRRGTMLGNESADHLLDFLLFEFT